MCRVQYPITRIPELQHNGLHQFHTRLLRYQDLSFMVFFQVLFEMKYFYKNLRHTTNQICCPWESTGNTLAREVYTTQQPTSRLVSPRKVSPYLPTHMFNKCASRTTLWNIPKAWVQFNISVFTSKTVVFRLWASAHFFTTTSKLLPCEWRCCNMYSWMLTNVEK